MSYFSLICKSWIMGLAIALPFDAIALLCIRKTQKYGLFGALTVGIGAACADALYGTIACVGLHAVAGVLLKNMAIVHMVGGLFLLGLGIKEIKRNEFHDSVSTKSHSLYTTTTAFFLGITNPMTLLLFQPLFFSFFSDFFSPSSFSFDGVLVFLGIYLGSITWWISLGTFTKLINSKLSDKVLLKMNMISAILFIGFGVFSIFKSLN